MKVHYSTDRPFTLEDISYDDTDELALKRDIPEPVDLSNYALKSDIPKDYVRASGNNTIIGDTFEMYSATAQASNGIFNIYTTGTNTWTQGLGLQGIEDIITFQSTGINLNKSTTITGNLTVSGTGKQIQP